MQAHTPRRSFGRWLLPAFLAATAIAPTEPALSQDLQRQVLVLRQLEHALVELEPGQLAVRVELGGIELGYRWRFGHSFHVLSLYGAASR